MGAPRPDVEAEVRSRATAGDWDGATTAALRGYGTDVLAFLAALHRSADDASDVFAWFAEGVWRGLPKFAWESTLRTWLYAIARRCSLRFRRDGRRRAARQTPLPESSNASILVAKLRSKTASLFATERQSRMAALRASLPADDQTLLMLRVDRDLAWNELAIVMADEDTPLDDEGVKREAARLRKRFQLVKERLRELATKEGIR